MDRAEAGIEIAGVGRLRPMAGHDLASVLDWRNAPGVRAHMYTTHLISPEDRKSVV